MSKICHLLFNRYAADEEKLTMYGSVSPVFVLFPSQHCK